MKMQLELIGLLRDAKANPDEIAPRLILADWLEEHGDPARAEFVRLQCLGTTPEEKRRAKQLAHAHESRWLGAVHGATHRRTWKRGLLEASATPEQILHASFASEEQEVFEWIEHLRLNNFVHADLEALVAAPHLRTLNALALVLNYSDSAYRELDTSPTNLSWAALGNLPTLPHLHELTLHGLPLDAGGLEGLFAAVPEQLRELFFQHSRYSNLSAARMAALPILPNLRALTLRMGWDESLLAWGNWPGLTVVERLSLHGVEPPELAPLLASPHWGALRELDVLCGVLGGTDLVQFLASPPIGHLRSLRMYAIDAESVPTLIACRALDRLERLTLDTQFELTAEACQALRDHFGERLLMMGDI